jgi:hypothetical protein
MMDDSLLDHAISSSLSEPEEAKLCVCEHGLELADSLKLTKMVLELDSLSVVETLNSMEVDRSRYGPLIEKLKRAIRGVDDHLVKWAW